MIITPIILTVTLVIVLIGIFVTSRGIAKIDGNILLNITLPHEALTDYRVTDIVSRYKKANTAMLVLFAILLIPFWLMMDYISIPILYTMLWLIMLLCFNQANAVKYARELYALKKENSWWVGTPNIISIDTEVSRLKDTFPVSKAWFILPLILTAATIIGFAQSGWGLLHGCIALHNFILFITFFLLYIVRMKDRSVTYSENTEVNMAINRAYKRELSKCFVFIACAESIISTIAIFLFPDKLENIVFLSAFFSISLILLVPIISAYNRVRSVKNKFIEANNNTIYADDDIYWTKFLYSNPNDNRILVGTRMGTSTNINIARTGVKVGALASLTVFAGLIVFLTAIFIPLDFGSITVDFSPDAISIHAPLDAYSFAVNDIKEVSLLENISITRKINGADSSEVLIGKFNVSGYGVSMVYLYRNNPPYIAVKLSNGWVFLNGETREQTDIYYETIKSEIEQSAQ